MKKVFFLPITLAIIFFSCSTNNKLAQEASSIESNFDSPDNIFQDSSFVDAKLAELMIKAFPKHKYRGWRKKRLLNTWATFSPHLLEEATKNKAFTITYFMAAILDEGDSSGLPTVLMQVKHGSSTVAVNGKGVDSEDKFPAFTYSYYKPISICPPPPTGCKLQN